MRSFVLALMAGLLATSALNATTKHGARHTTVAMAAPACEYPADRTAFDIEGLKSQLMVTALACKQQDKYNEFMSRYQPELAREESDLNGYFRRSYGKQSTKAYDDYISNLANVQEQDGLKAGSSFCANLPVMFEEVMSLHDTTELHDYVNSKIIAQPITFESCSGTPPASSGSRRTRHSGHSSTRHS